MKGFLVQLFLYTRSAAIILFCLLSGQFLSPFLNLPGSIIGLLILFTLLSLKGIRFEWVYPCGNILLKNIMLFFVPVCVGLLNYIEILKLFLVEILMVSFVSTVLILITVGWLFQKVQK